MKRKIILIKRTNKSRGQPKNVRVAREQSLRRRSVELESWKIRCERQDYVSFFFVVFIKKFILPVIGLFYLDIYIHYMSQKQYFETYFDGYFCLS